MTTNRDILDLLQRLAPPALAEDWDNNGLLCGRLDRQLHRLRGLLEARVVRHLRDPPMVRCASTPYVRE